MKYQFEFEGTAPRAAMRYGTPELPETPRSLIFAGGSAFGSHSVKEALHCVRAAGYGFGRRNPPTSRGDGSCEFLVDTYHEVIHKGPHTATESMDLMQSIWMARGSLIHVALAHAFVKLAIEGGTEIVVCGYRFNAEHKELFYTPEEALEAAAAILGPVCHTYALPAARRMLPGALAWAHRLFELEIPIAVETQVAMHVPLSPFVYTSRLDLLTQDRGSGLAYAHDYKTANDTGKASKRRYALSAQMAGQDQILQRIFGTRWGGVKVDLIQDPGEKGEKPFKVEEYRIPRHPVGYGLVPAVQDAQQRISPHLGKPISEWPGNPFHCSGCSFAKICFGL